MPFSETALKRNLQWVEQAQARGLLSAGAARNLRDWLTEPPYRTAFDDIDELIAAGDNARLEELFWQQIPFGTGGRRGPMSEFGSATINARTIAESAHGLATYFQQSTGSAGGKGVVAHDTRHRSAEFARITATTLAAQGFKVYLFESFRSTPELSFAVRRLGCDVGVMITASHNPPADNGFKAYWSSGGQILAPHDKGVIRCVEAAGEIPTCDFGDAVAEGQIEIIGREVDEAYWQAVLGMSLSKVRELPGLYSPLHGVGQTCCGEVLQRAGFRGIELFPPHATPDGDFPNVPDQLPNPERAEVFTPMFERARAIGADVLLASDPDSDRLGVCVRDPQGEYVHLSGNRIGVLLVDYVLRKRAAQGSLSPKHFVVETLVTSRLIGAIARAHGVRVIDDLLVGFKYIGETIDSAGPELFVFGCEESLGYLAGTYARDKDAGVASLYMAECAAELRAAGKSLLDRLDELYVEHGYCQEGQISRTCTGAEGSQQIEQIMSAFRTSPPRELGGALLGIVHDYQQHESRKLPENRRSADLPHPAGDLLIFESAAGAATSIRVAARPSGTEPKIKFYLFATAARVDPSALPAVKEATDAALRQVGRDLQAWIAAVLGE